MGAVLSTSDADAAEVHGAPVPFYGAHQAGIDTAAQDRLAFAAFDVTTTNVSDVQELLREWTTASAAMCAGALVPGSSTQLDAQPRPRTSAHRRSPVLRPE